MTATTLVLPLPEGYRPADVLAFHRRDPEQVAERVGEAGLEKGMVRGGVPACLTIRFLPGEVRVGLHADGSVGRGPREDLAALVRRMLGLDQDVEEFERRHRRHRQLGPLIARRPGLRVPVAATPFEALTWAVTGQQISVAAAVALRRRLIAAAGVRHSGGLLCYPDAAALAALDPEALRRAGLSAAKTATLLAVARLVADDRLPLDAWARTPPVAAIREGLLAVRGIGPWTVDYTLLRGYGWLDGSLHGDAAVRRGLQRLLGAEARIDEAQARDWLAGFSPWRALVAAHLWAMHSAAGG